MTPTSPPQPRKPYGSGRQELIQAAVQVVVEEGIGKLSHRRVAAAAGVTHGLVRHYFGNTASLIAAALDETLSHNLANNPISALLQDPGLPDDRLMQWIDEQLDLQVFEYEVVLASRRNPELQPLLTKLYEGYARVAREAFETHGLPVPPAGVIELIDAALIGVVLQAVTFRSTDDARLIGAMAALRNAVRAGTL